MNFLEGINHYWGIILFFAGLIFHALWTYFKVGQHDTRIETLEGISNDNSDIVNGIRNQISAIDSKLDILLTGYHKSK